MKLSLRIAAVLTVLTAALSVPPAAVAATSPSARLTGVGVTFVTTDENKDADTELSLNLLATDGRLAATFKGYTEEFGTGSVHGPYPLQTFTGIYAFNLAPGTFKIRVVPYSHDTWRFNYTVKLAFSDGSTYTFGATNQTVSEKETEQQVQTSFTVTSQTTVPDLAHLKADAAQAAIRAAGLTVGTTSNRVDKDCVDIGRVVHQDPAAGKLVDVGSTVNISVGIAPPICQ